MGCTSSKHLELTDLQTTAEATVVNLVAELIKESDPPSKASGVAAFAAARIDRSEVALKTLSSWDAFVDDTGTVLPVEEAAGADEAWCESVLSGAKQAVENGVGYLPFQWHAP